jgi:hypothetical protein
MRQIEVVCVPVKISYTCERLAFLNRAAGNACVSQETLQQSLSRAKPKGSGQNLDAIAAFLSGFSTTVSGAREKPVLAPKRPASGPPPWKRSREHQ